MPMKTNLLIAAALLPPLAACTSARSPDRIDPTYVNSLAFQGMSCKALNAKAAQTDAALATATEKQKRAYTSDAVSGFLIGVPVATMSGQDIGAEVGRLKGEQWALGDVRKAKKCV